MATGVVADVARVITHDEREDEGDGEAVRGEAGTNGRGRGEGADTGRVGGRHAAGAERVTPVQSGEE